MMVSLFGILSIFELLSMKLRIQTNRYFNSIDQFSFIKEIGVGSFGTVKLALHITTNKCYAVKVVDISQNISENELLLLEREINLHSTVDHPHIIKLWDSIIENNFVYMVMELAENGTLFTYQNKHRTISEAQTFKFFSQTLSAIRYLHSHDIMHRDIKPENILLDNACNVKICDLGWATDNIQMKRKTFCGTYQYMAPEMVFEQEYNYTIDNWALGILLYELLHGYAPFPAKNLDEMKQKVKLGYYQLGTNFSKDLKSLIVQVLQFESDQRPPLQKVLAHPWMQRMRKEIRGEIGKIQNELKGEVSNRAKVEREKGSQVGKKHKRFDSLMNEQHIKNAAPNYDLTGAIDRLMEEEKKNNRKKKCKTQGEQSIEKLLTESGKTLCGKPKWKKDKQNNSQVKLTTELSKTTFTFKKQSNFSNLKMKRIADKLNELAHQYPDKKKTRLKTQKDQLQFH